MAWTRITPDNTEFAILCFEGPDAYSMVGGLGVRINNLSGYLAQKGFSTHLFFVGDPNEAPEETRCHGRLNLHRWCQHISRHYPGGVYDGEQAKATDYEQSIPAYVEDRIVRPALEKHKMVVILAEEWQTAAATCRLNQSLSARGLRDKAVVFWNANNTFGFPAINWQALNAAGTITTVSRYMKHIMGQLGLNPMVIPNGIPKSLLRRQDDSHVGEVRHALGSDLLLCKVARWDPDKMWTQAMEAVAKLKDEGLQPVLVARGGSEPYGREVVHNAAIMGLRLKETRTAAGSKVDYLSALRRATPYADVISVRTPLPLDFLRLLYRAADGVLANSRHEPFGIVGLEAMAVGGIAFTGCTGEDYAIQFVNSVVLESEDPMEMVGYITFLKAHPEEAGRIRKAARRTAQYFTWDAAVQTLINKLENQARAQGLLKGTAYPPPLPDFDSRTADILCQLRQ